MSGKKYAEEIQSKNKIKSIDHFNENNMPLKHLESLCLLNDSNHTLHEKINSVENNITDCISVSNNDVQKESVQELNQPTENDFNDLQEHGQDNFTDAISTFQNTSSEMYQLCHSNFNNSQDLNTDIYEDCSSNYDESEQYEQFYDAASEELYEEDLLLNYAGKAPKQLNKVLNLLMFKESNLTVHDVLNMIECLYLQHNLTHEFRDALIGYTKFLAGPEFERLNLNDYYMSQFFKPKEDVKTYTFFCPDCNIALSEPLIKSKLSNKLSVKCKICSKDYVLSTTKNNFFINIDVEYQIRCLLKNEKIFDMIITSALKAQEDRKKDVPSYRDVHDGQLFRENEFFKNKKDNDIVLTANVGSDGGAMFEKPKSALWFISLMLNNLPTKLKSKFLLPAALLYVMQEPSLHLINLFMEVFLKNNYKLIMEGIPVYSNTFKKTFRIYLLPLIWALDTVARALAASRKKFNGYFGCSWCYIEGLYSKGSMRYTIEKSNQCNDRTKEAYKKDVDESIAKKKSVNGVKGASRICEILPFFDPIWGFPPEYMHGILIGVIKQLWLFWTKKSCKFYVNKDLVAIVEKRLLAIRPTNEFYRLPTTLGKRSIWKAADWLFWLIWFSLPCLRGLLDIEVYKSYALLVKSVHTLLSRNISEEQLVQCEADLKQFVQDCEKFYGKEFMTFNVHLLTHLCTSVRKGGPLPGFSAFAFESLMGLLKQFTMGPNGVIQQIGDRVLEKNEFHARIATEKQRSSTHFCNSVLSNENYVINHIRTKDNAIIPRDCTSDHRNIYNRCIFKGTPLHSLEYSRPERTDNTFVRLTDQSIAQIQHFSIINGGCYATIKIIQTKIVVICGVRLNHISYISSYMDETKIIPITNVQKKLIHVKIVDDIDYICEPIEDIDAE